MKTEERLARAEAEIERLRKLLEAEAVHWEREGRDGDPVTEGDWITHCHWRGQRLRQALGGRDGPADPA
jgi:hypothetical protein